MKNFNRMTEKQMASKRGGMIEFFFIFLVSTIVTASVGAIAGTAGGVAATNPKK